MQDITGVTVYDESDDEYNGVASVVGPAADRDLPEDRDPLEASGPSEDRHLTEDRDPPESSGVSRVRNLPKARGGPSENRNPTVDSDPTNDGSTTSQYQVLLHVSM